MTKSSIVFKSVYNNFISQYPNRLIRLFRLWKFKNYLLERAQGGNKLLVASRKSSECSPLAHMSISYKPI